MKACPICKAKAFDDAAVCYGCLYSYEKAEATKKERAKEETGCDDLFEPEPEPEPEPVCEEAVPDADKDEGVKTRPSACGEASKDACFACGGVSSGCLIRPEITIRLELGDSFAGSRPVQVLTPAGASTGSSALADRGIGRTVLVAVFSLACKAATAGKALATTAIRQ